MSVTLRRAACSLVVLLCSAALVIAQQVQPAQPRTVQPRTNKTPWIMPGHLNDPVVAVFPPDFAARVHGQSLV